jgi:colicin import membrane protein
MSRHNAGPLEASSGEPAPAGSAAADAAPPRRPNLSGDLDAMLTPTPAFRIRPLGYDRLQVDNYVDWAETTLLTARQETDDLLNRYGRCWAELDVMKSALVHSPAGQQMAQVTERIGSMLQLAADEAAEITATAAAEAARIQREARADADSRLLRAQEAQQLAVADAARLRREAETDRAEAATARQQAEREAEEAAQTRARLDGEAAQLREQLDREAAERVRQQFEAARARQEAAEAAALERLARVDEEAAELERRREVARTSLIWLCDQLSQAVATTAERLPAPGLRLAPPQQAAS